MKLNLGGYVTPTTSYGLILLNIIKGMEEKGVEISLFPIGNTDPNCLSFTESVKKSIHNSIKFDSSSPYLRVAHQFDMAYRIGKGRGVGYTCFEMDKLTDFEKRHLSSLDLLILPTKWAADVCKASDLQVETAVVPLGYDPSIFGPVNYINKEKCIFLSIGKWEKRKCQDEIVKAFELAFKNNDEAELWMSFDNKFLGEDFIDGKKNEYGKLLAHKIRFIPRVNTQQELARIIKQAYCFVGPSRAEGFNLELLESMGCGLHTIATNYSGHTEFAPADICHLVEPIGMIKAEDNKWFNMTPYTNNGDWADFNIQDLSDRMSEVFVKYKNKDRNSDIIVQHAQQFTWEKTIDKLIKILF
jgi:hypothetical protein